MTKKINCSAFITVQINKYCKSKIYAMTKKYHMAHGFSFI